MLRTSREEVQQRFLKICEVVYTYRKLGQPVNVKAIERQFGYKGHTGIFNTITGEEDPNTRLQFFLELRKAELDRRKKAYHQAKVEQEQEGEELFKSSAPDSEAKPSEKRTEIVPAVNWTERYINLAEELYKQALANSCGMAEHLAQKCAEDAATLINILKNSEGIK